MISITSLRSILREKYGKYKYRITSDGSVLAYKTPMTNTNQDGWAFIGYVSELRREYASEEKGE